MILLVLSVLLVLAIVVLVHHEHAYVGANVFYDYAFKDKFSRVVQD